jgi:hypothetical protein
MPVTIGEGKVTLEIWKCHYSAQCSSPGRRFVARIVLARVTADGVLGGQSHRCFKHTRQLLAQAKADGIDVSDMRGLKAPHAARRR